MLNNPLKINYNACLKDKAKLLYLFLFLLVFLKLGRLRLLERDFKGIMSFNYCFKLIIYFLRVRLTKNIKLIFNKLNINLIKKIFSLELMQKKK